MGIERWVYAVRLRLRALVNRDGVEQDLDDELQDYVAHAIEDHLARGLAPAEARRRALIALGGLERRKEECRDARGLRLVDELRQDARYAVRTLAHARGFTIGAVLTLALGIGASVAVFTIVNGVLLRPLPFPDPDRLVVVWSRPSGLIGPPLGMWDRDYLTFRASDRSFEHAAAFSSYDANLLSPSEPLHVSVARVTTEFFDTLRISPAIGRGFLPGDELQADSLVVLGGDVWRGSFASDPAIVGRTVRLDGVARTVVGVMPDGLAFPRAAQAWTLQTIRYDEGRIMGMTVIGRLKPGVTREQAEADFEAFVRRQPDRREGWQAGVSPLVDLLVFDVRRPLQIFAGAVMLVLLIACANVANLVLARASGRHREIALRAALGASRPRLVRQLLTESTVLALAGGIAGVVLALWAVPALLAIAPAGRIPRTELVRVDARVLAFAVGVSLMTGVLFGLAPAIRMTRRRRAESLAPGLRRAAREPERARAVLVVAEIAIALVLLTGAGLLLQSFLRMRSVDLGLRPRNVLAMSVDLPDASYTKAEQVRAFHRALLTRLGGLPSVTGATLVNWLPMGTMTLSGDYAIQSRPGEFYADKPAVSQGYFRQMGIRVLEGRDFTDQDDASHPGVAIVSRSVANVIDPAGHALGKRVAMGIRPGPDDWLTIIGIVEDVRQNGPLRPPRPALYQSYAQVSTPLLLTHVTFLVSAAADTRALAPSVRSALRSLDGTLAPVALVAMDDVVADTRATSRFHARLLGGFAVLALLLAVVGIYSVLAYSVAQRTHEIGVRMALGAERRAVVAMFLRRTLILSAAGIAVGVGAAVLTTRLLATLLFAITPTDPWTFVTGALAMLASALAAAWIPATRATRVDPLIALRSE